MPQSLCKTYIHLIFHVKTTSPKIQDDDIDRIHSYIGQLVNETGCIDIQVGGVADHVHILFILSKDVALSYVVEEIKRNSSRWIKSISPKYHMFAWQGGYGAFSVSQSVVSKTLEYIKGQREHHKRVSFADEYKAFLISYNIEYDERYVFKDKNAFALSGRRGIQTLYPGRCPGLGAGWAFSPHYFIICTKCLEWAKTCS